MDRKRATALFIAALATLAVSSGASAQVRASERGSVSQTVDGTVITIDYGRPQARGREPLFGAVVPWGKTWTPGANWATTLDVNRDILVNGHKLAAGTYSVWLKVEPDAWTAIFDPQFRRFHLNPPEESAQQLRFAVQPETCMHSETLTWSFSETNATGTTLRLAWGTTAVAFDIGVHPSRPLTVPADIAQRYVGRYRLVQNAPLPEKEVVFDITYENEHLVARWEEAPSPQLAQTWLVHLGEGMFVPAELEDGELFDIVTDLVFEFTPLEGPVSRFEMRALGDQLWGRGRRTH